MNDKLHVQFEVEISKEDYDRIGRQGVWLLRRVVIWKRNGIDDCIAVVDEK